LGNVSGTADVVVATDVVVDVLVVDEVDEVVDVEVVATEVVVVAVLVETTATATAVAGSSLPHAERAKRTTQPTAVALRRMTHSASGSALQHRDRRLLA
jgi:hypothetical protein